MDRETFAKQYDVLITESRMRELYGDSGYFNVGYWVDGISTLPAACDRLVDELASIVPADARLIVDVGCGVGGPHQRPGKAARCFFGRGDGCGSSRGR